MAGIEVELRFTVTDTDATIATLKAQGVGIAGRQHIIDQWFAPTNIKSLGFTPKRDHFDRSLTGEAMKALAQFDT